MLAFPKGYFQLQLDFADKMKGYRGLSLIKSIFLYTCFYARVVGFHDEHPPEENNQKWQQIIKDLPLNQNNQTDYFYEKYVDFEKNKPKKNNQLYFGCFAFSYHNDNNTFELHFRNYDQDKGNLGKDRIKVRQSELKQMFGAMKNFNKLKAKVFLRTWLFNIGAFTRLFPPKFIKASKLWNIQLAQDNSFWGQFVDRKGNLKENLAQQLRDNLKIKRSKINDYLPLPCLKSEVEQKIFYKFYKT